MDISSPPFCTSGQRAEVSARSAELHSTPAAAVPTGPEEEPSAQCFPFREIYL